jgi:hypothetical protein
MQNNPNNMNQPFQQGNLNHAVGGNQAYNPGRGGQVLQQQPKMHPATRPPIPQQQQPTPQPQQPTARTAQPVMQQGPMTPMVETKSVMDVPIDLNKIRGFSNYVRGLKNPTPQNYPEIDVFGTYF